MGTDRLICKHCGNTDSDKMDFTSDRRYIYCHVCAGMTPLYSEFKVVEMEGVQTLQSRLQSGETLLSLEKYEEAETVFIDLTKDYAGDYRTWFGLFRARSKNFSANTFDWDSMKNARAVAREDPEVTRMLDQVCEHCRAMQSLQADIQEKQREIDARNRSIGELNRSLSDAKEPTLKVDPSFEMKIAGLEAQNRKDEDARKHLSFKIIPILAVLGVGSVLWYGYQNSLYYQLEKASFIQSLLMLVYFLLMIGLCGSAVICTILFLISIPRRLQIRMEVAKRKRSIHDLQDQASRAELTAKRNLETDMSSFRQDRDRTQDQIRQMQSSTEASRLEIRNLQQEFSRHTEVLRELYPLRTSPA